MEEKRIDNLKLNRTEFISCAILIMATVISMAFRLFYGWDQDQSYLMLLPVKLSQGSMMFKDLWDLHQMGALIPAILCKIYYFIHGTFDGIAVFLRFISLLLQIGVSVYVFEVFKKYYGLCPALLSAIVTANMMPRAAQQLEYSTIAIWSAIIVNLLLLKVYKEGNNTYRRIAIAGFFYGLVVFSYPTMIITVPFYFIVVGFAMPLEAKSRMISTAVFFLVCLIMALTFFVYIFSYISIPDFINILKALGENGDHETFFSAIHHVDSWMGSLLRIIATVALAFVITWMINRAFSCSINPFFVYILLVTLMVVLPNITSVRISGPFGFLERYIGTVLMTLCIIRKSGDKALFILFYLLGLTYYLGALMGSNLGFNENAMYLELTLIASVLFAGKYLEKYGRLKRKCFEKAALLIFVIGIAFSSGFLVRVNYTAPANIRQCSYKFEDGPLKGIYVRDDYYEEVMARIKAISELTESDKSYALLGNESIYNFYVKGTVIAPGFAPTTEYNQQWIDFYSKFDNELPDVLLLSTYWFQNVEEFCDTTFGNWVKNDYDTNSTEFDEEFLMMIQK